MLIDISKIKVAERIRKDFGNIKELADDIKENGLINPPVVTPDFELIAGERRLRAMKYLGYEQVEVRVMTVKDALHQLKLEISENENRKDFNFTEKMEWAEKLKKEYSRIAKEKMLMGVHDPRLNSDEGMRTDEAVAQDLDMGRDTYRKAEYIYNNADKETIQKLNEEKISIHKAWTQTKEKLAIIEKQKKELEDELENRPVVEKEKIVETEVYPDDYHQMRNDLEFLKHQLQEKNKERPEEPKCNDHSIIDEFQSIFQFKVNDFMTALSDCSVLINPFIFMDNYYKKMEQKHIDYLLKEVSKLENDIKDLKSQIKYQGGIVNE